MKFKITESVICDVIASSNGYFCNTHQIWIHKYKWEYTKAQSFGSHKRSIQERIAIANDYGMSEQEENIIKKIKRSR